MSPLGSGTVGSAPSLQKITLKSKDGRYVLTALSGPDPSEPTDGRGGFEEVQRNRKAAASQWVGTGLLKTTVTVMLDAWSTQGSVEPDLRIVDGLAPVSPATEPQPLTVTGVAGISPNTPWAVQSVTYTDRLRRDSDGATSRVQVAFELLESRPADVVIVRSDPAKRSADRHATPPRSKPKTYTVKAGDSLAGIAAKLLGKASRWPEIAKLQTPAIKNPNSLTAGRVLKLPS